MGPKRFSAKNVCARDLKIKVTAVSVREPIIYAVANVIRVQYDLLATMSFIITNYFACPNAQPLDTDVFASCSDTDIQTQLQKYLQCFTAPLTISQRCAGWFLLRKFCITATVAPKILLKDPAVRNELQLLSSTDPVQIKTVDFNASRALFLTAPS